MSDKGGISRTTMNRWPPVRQWQGAQSSTSSIEPALAPPPSFASAHLSFQPSRLDVSAQAISEPIVSADVETDLELSLEILLAALGNNLAATAQVGAAMTYEEVPA